jgi:molybdopterin synthase catalytic subunit
MSVAGVVYRVLLFAGLRERTGRGEVEIELAPGATAADLVAALARAHPEIGPALAGCRVAVDCELVEARAVVPAGAELAVLPPVSGGHDGGRVRCRLSDAPLSLDEAVASVRHDGAGAVATFCGQVRARSRGKAIERLEYEAYAPMALRTMNAIAETIERELPGTAVAIHHRVGTLAVGQTAVVIAASAPHRAEAFDACRRAIEALKRDVPIWKKEFATDGATWIGRGA